jgi:peptidoglycan/xylan/chitin deacetylase (PgdA/CDA1 family)
MPKIVMLHSVGRSDGRYIVSVPVISKIIEKKAIILSFDDGYSDIFVYAQDMFKRLSGRAMIFLVAGKIGLVNDWDSSCELAGKPLLGWEQIGELRKSGVEFGSHSLTHPDLTKLRSKELEREIKESKRILEERLGNPIDGFSYPFGLFNNQVILALRNAGYKWAVTTSDSIWEGLGNPYRLRRISVSGVDPKWLLRIKLNGLYDIKAFWDLPKLVTEKIRLTLKGNS